MSYPPRVVDFSKFFCFFSASFLFWTGNDSKDCSVWNLQTIPTANVQKLSLSFVAVVLLKHLTCQNGGAGGREKETIHGGADVGEEFVLAAAAVLRWNSYQDKVISTEDPMVSP